MFDQLYIPNQAGPVIVYFAAGLGAGISSLDEAASWTDRLLNEALDESFPASDPVSSLKFD